MKKTLEQEFNYEHFIRWCFTKQEIERQREREGEKKKEQIRNLLQLLWQFEVIARVALAENGEYRSERFGQIAEEKCTKGLIL